jgi:hypothetical protein
MLFLRPGGNKLSFDSRLFYGSGKPLHLFVFWPNHPLGGWFGQRYVLQNVYFPLFPEECKSFKHLQHESAMQTHEKGITWLCISSDQWPSLTTTAAAFPVDGMISRSTASSSMSHSTKWSKLTIAYVSFHWRNIPELMFPDSTCCDQPIYLGGLATNSKLNFNSTVSKVDIGNHKYSL